MQPRRTFLVCLLIACTLITSAQQTGKSKKKSSSPAALATYGGGLRDTCLDKKFSIVFYGIDDSTSSRTTSLYNEHIDSLLKGWNRAFAKICVSFERCSTVLIPQYEYNRWSFGKTDPKVLKSYYTENVINVYLPEFVEDLPGLETSGYAYASYDPGMLKPVPKAAREATSTVIVMNTGPQQPAIPPADIVVSVEYTMEAVHIMGHFFGLPDSFSEVSSTPASPTSSNTSVISTEYADGSNSAVNGDSFQDTEADPYPVGQSAKVLPCFYGGEITDGKGQKYIPPVDNFMSKYVCACRFTQQQYNYMAWYILQKRMHLH